MITEQTTRELIRTIRIMEIESKRDKKIIEIQERYNNKLNKIIDDLINISKEVIK